MSRPLSGMSKKKLKKSGVTLKRLLEVVSSDDRFVCQYVGESVAQPTMSSVRRQ